MSAIEQVKPTPVRSGGEGGGITSWWTNTRTFLTEVRNEMRRVTWPSRKEVYATTVVVIRPAGCEILSASSDWKLHVVS